MKKTLISLITCILLSAGGSTAYAAFEFGESFSLYSNSSPMEDDSADDLDPVPIGDATGVLIFLAGVYAYRIYSRKKKAT